MGARGNILFSQGMGYIGLYLHNGGYNMKEKLAHAIQRVVDCGRVSDIGYANRIAISDIIGDDWSQNYSYGLYAGATMNEAIADNEYDIIVVDWNSEQVLIYDFDYGKWQVTTVKESYTFNEFVSKYLQH